MLEINSPGKPPANPNAVDETSKVFNTRETLIPFPPANLYVSLALLSLLAQIHQ